MQADRFSIVKANVLLFFCYELAYTVNLGKLEELLEKLETHGLVSLRRSKSHYLRFESYPLLIKLGDEKVTIGSRESSVSIQARVFDYGVVSLCFDVPFSGSFEELISQAALLSESDTFYKISKTYLERIRKTVSPSLVNPIESDLVEDYTIFRISELSPRLDGNELLNRLGREIAMILRAERRDLSTQEMEHALSNSISYYPQDVLIIDWDRAFIYDREEHTDHMSIIEFANTQLLDMRYYDRWLDSELELLYRGMQTEGERTPIFRVARYRHLSKRTMLLMADVIWLTDRIDNSLKSIDTLYAARVHRAVSQKLYLDEWKSGLDKKLGALRDISSNLNMKIYNFRSVTLELAIVILILAEIVILFFV
jgi:hypothetical protein